MLSILPTNENFVQSLKKFSIVALFVIAACIPALSQPGTAMSFNGDDDGDNIATRVDLPNILTASYTKEAWVNAPMNNVSANSNNIVSGTGTAFWFPQTQSYRLSAGHSFPFTAVQDPVPLEANRWYHVAVTYDAPTTTLRLYKNGILVATNTSVPNHSESTLYIGAYIAANYMKGYIDDVRIWSVALSEANIRDWMCRNVTSSHPQWSNLIAYYKGNEGSGTTVSDSKNSNNGTFVNGSGWVVSGAAIGDESAHDYVNATKSATLTHTPSGHTFTATSTSGSPDGIQVYRVDAAPTNATGVAGIGNNDKYFGVFQVGGTSPQYTAVYNYGNGFGPNESSLRLYKRADNSAASWTNSGATQDAPSNTLTVTGESTEYILGSIGVPLPVTFTSFNVRQVDKQVKLTWSTGDEANNLGFYIERSESGAVWQSLGFVPASGSTSGDYSFIDANPLRGSALYRIRQVDIDTRSSYSDIRRISLLPNSQVALFPTPATNSVILNITKESLLHTKATIVNLQGKILSQFQIQNFQTTIQLETFANGTYVLKLADGTALKIIKK